MYSAEGGDFKRSRGAWDKRKKIKILSELQKGLTYISHLNIWQNNERLEYTMHKTIMKKKEWEKAEQLAAWKLKEYLLEVLLC